MGKFMNDAAENLIEGAKNKKQADKWLKIAKATRFIKPISRFAADQAMMQIQLAEIHFKVSDCLVRVDQLEKKTI